jgi:predicted RNA-binding Zn-ribbon protein involved in translation (DUF1610 family)
MNDSFPPPGYIPAQSAIDGIEVYLPTPPDLPTHQETVEFKCPQCGAVTAYSAADGGLTCTHCGFYEAPQKEVVGKDAAHYEFTKESLEPVTQTGVTPAAIPPSEVAPEELEDRKEMACQSCGALTSIPVDSLSHTCPFCGSNEVIQRQAPQDLLRPRFLIPFKIEASDCEIIARNWLGSSWMTPASLRNLANLAAFHGVYLPFWTFHAINDADWKAEVGHTKKERYYADGEWKERIVVIWLWESGHVQLNIDNLLVPGTARLSATILYKVKNFDLSALAPYEPKYLAGLQAQTYDIPLEHAWETGRAEMREQTRQACLSQASTSQVRNFSMNLDFSDESWRYVLLPIHLAAYKYDNQTYQVMVNGQTGEIAGQRPADWNKIWLVIATLLSPGVLLGLVGFITIPLAGAGVIIGILGFILLVIGLVIAFILYNHALALDDA